MKVPRVSGSNVKRRRESCVHPSPGDRHALTNYPYVAARLARTVYAYIFYKFLSSLSLRRAPGFSLSYNKGNITVCSPLCARSRSIDVRWGPWDILQIVAPQFHVNQKKEMRRCEKCRRLFSAIHPRLVRLCTICRVTRKCEHR